MAGEARGRSASISSGSIMSNIHVAASFTSSQVEDVEHVSHSPTPPTSVTGESAGSDGASIKQEASISLSREPSVTLPAPIARDASTEGDLTRRRSVRSKLSVESYNLATLSELQHGKNEGGFGGTRSFSGDTLVNDVVHHDEPEASGARELRRQILEGQVEKALDMTWQVGQLEDARPSSAGTTESKKKSASLGRISKAAGKIKSALGKRSRAADDDTGSKRLSRATSAPTLGQVDDMDPEPPSKKARLLDALAEMTTSLNRAVSVKKPKKTWLTHGLYCGQNESATSTSTITAPAAVLEGSTLDSSKPRTLMPYPMYSAGTRESAFKIPFDVFAPLKKKENPKEWKKLSKNSFTPSAKEVWRTKKLERSICLCPATAAGAHDGCDEDCLNRIMGYECDESNCSLPASQCSNRAFAELAKRTKDGNEFDIGVEIIKTKECGYGLRSNRSFAPGQIIIEYCGEVITQEESDRRMHELYKDSSAYYLMEFDQGMIIDATKGNITRFVNHSCAPNCTMEKRVVRGEPRMALFAGPNGVTTGEELSYDYNFDNFSSLNALDCRCGAEFCRGKLMRRDAKQEKENLAASLRRKVEEAKQAASVTPEPSKPALLKKRKTARWSKGWAYIDPEMEAQRLKEDALEQGRDVSLRAVELLKEATEKKDDRKVNIVLKEHGKRGASLKARDMLKRATSVTSTVSRRSVPAGEKREKRKSVFSRTGGVLKAALSSPSVQNDESEEREEIVVNRDSSPEVDMELDDVQANPFEEQAALAGADSAMTSADEDGTHNKGKGKGKALLQSTLDFSRPSGNGKKSSKKAGPPKMEELDEDVDVLEMVLNGGLAARGF